LNRADEIRRDILSGEEVYTAFGRSARKIPSDDKQDDQQDDGDGLKSAALGWHRGRRITVRRRIDR
jgi:hypothetical protein